MSLIELRGVSKGFFTDRKKTTAKIALDGVDLRVEEGEFVSLIGPSGCGKTVTLSMMAGFEQPTLGEVLFRGEPVSGPGPERGVVFQEYSLLPWLSVEQNVAFSVRNAMRATAGDGGDRSGTGLALSPTGRPRPRRSPSSEARRRAREALATVGLLDSAGERPNTLSGGMKQRVAIARLLAMDSDVFLMDEPFSALDEQTRRALDESLFRLWRQHGKTIVFVTHNISEAVLMSSRIVLFSASPGRILREWELPADLERDLASPAVAAIADEIRAHLPLSPCEFALDQG